MIESDIEKIVLKVLSSREVQLVSRERAMEILDCDETTLAFYRRKGLRSLNTRPAKYLMSDIKEFVDGLR